MSDTNPEIERPAAAAAEQTTEPAPEQPSPEQAARERRIWLIITICGVIVAAAVMALYWPVMAGRLEAAKDLDRATALVKGADAPMAAIDVAVHAPLSPETGRTSVDLAARITPATRTLTEAVKLLDTATPRLTEDEQRRGALVKKVARLRLEMLARASVILGAQGKAVQASQLADNGWQEAQSGAGLEAQAAAEYNKKSMSGVQSAAALNDQATQQFSLARSSFAEAASTLPEADFGPFFAFVDARLAQVSLSRQSDAAWIAGRKDEARTLALSYNAASARSIELAKSLPSSPNVAVDAGFKKATSSALEAYEKARDEAGKATADLKSL